VVAHVCNPSYSRGRDQEEHSLKPAWANSSETLSQKILQKNRAGGVAQGEDPVIKPQYCKKFFLAVPRSELKALCLLVRYSIA
jgi:hypothetical protein